MVRNSQDSRQMAHRGLAASLIGAWGLYQIVLGLYFILIRPSFLPEDLRASGTTLEAVRSAAPGIEAWLNLVFAVLGGQMATSGVLLTATAWRVFKGHRPAAVEVATCIVAGLFSVTLMSAVNFVLGSDFRWFLIARHSVAGRDRRSLSENFEQRILKPPFLSTSKRCRTRLKLPLD